MKKVQHISIFIPLLSFLVSCHSNPLDIDLPKNNISIQYTNVDPLLNISSIEKIKHTIDSLKEELGYLFMYEISQDIRSEFKDSNSYNAVYNFYNTKYVSELQEEKKKIYDQLPKQEKKITRAFRYFAYYFGDSLLPHHIFYINKLFSRINCSDSSISIGLENYISPENKVIQSIPTSQLFEWQREGMNIKYLPRDVLLNWIQIQLFDKIDGKLAAHFIQAGKVLYILNATFPQKNEAYILRYSQEEYQWATHHESMVWDFLIKHQILFKNDPRVKANFLNAGPRTVGLPKESPDRMGQFIGYQIVKNFMLQNESLTLQKLIHTKYNKILQSYDI